MAEVVLRRPGRRPPAPRRRPRWPTGWWCRAPGPATGTPASPWTPGPGEALDRRGYDDHGHRARPFRAGWFGAPTWWCAWTAPTSRPWSGLGRGRAGDDRYDGRLVLLRPFDPRAGGAVDVPDPYYGDDTDFDGLPDLVEAGCRGRGLATGSELGPAGSTGGQTGGSTVRGEAP